LKTFNVVPITNRLGSLEWVNSTEPLKQIINREHMQRNKGQQLHNSQALHKMRDFLKKLPANKGVENLAQ